MAYQVISPIMNYFLANNMAKDYTTVEGEMCQFVQINPTSNASFQEPIYFNSQTMLDGENATITGIEFLTPTSLLLSPEGLVNDYTNSTAKYGILYISDLKRQIIAQLPLYSLVTQNNGGKIKKFVKFPIIIPSKNTALLQVAEIFLGQIYCNIIEDYFYKKK